MKRYNAKRVVYADLCGLPVAMVPDPTGEWVRFDDVAVVIARVRHACGEATQGYLGKRGELRDVLMDVSDMLRVAIADLEAT